MENYFKVSAISNSSLSYINPAQGGSPQFFRDFRDGRLEKKDSTGFEKGNLLHTYMLEPSKFKVLQYEKPTAMMGEFAEAFIKEFKNIGMTYTESTDIESDEKNAKKNDENVNTIIDSYNLLTERLTRYLPLGYSMSNEIIDNVDTFIKLMRYVYRKNNFYKSQKEHTWLKAFVESSLNYVEEAISSEGMIGINSEVKNALTRMIESLKRKELCDYFLNDNSLLHKGKHTEVFNELELFWVKEIECPVTNKVIKTNLKGKVDRLIIDFDNGIVYNIDLKTTGLALSFYGNKYGDYFKRKHYRQNAFYDEGIKNYMVENYSVDNFEIKHINIVIETMNQFNCAVYETYDEVLNLGLHEIKQLLGRIAFHEIHGWDSTLEEYMNKGYTPLEQIFNNSK